MTEIDFELAIARAAMDPHGEAFRLGARNVSVMRVGDEYIARIMSWREVQAIGAASLTEHASVEARGKTPDDALRNAVVELVRGEFQRVTHGNVKRVETRTRKALR